MGDSGYRQQIVDKEIQDLFDRIGILQARINQANQPLSRFKFIDGGTLTPAASQNGSDGLPFSTIANFMTSIGVGASAADSQATMVGLLTPSLNGYTENVT